MHWNRILTVYKRYTSHLHVVKTSMVTLNRQSVTLPPLPLDTYTLLSLSLSLSLSTLSLSLSLSLSLPPPPPPPSLSMHSY